jgi:hypothetical protein
MEPRTVGRSFNERLYGLGAGCQALHAAILLGGSPIFLLGYDFYEDRGSHFDVVDESRNCRDVYRHVRECIDELARAPWLPAIYNCNPASKLTSFPYISIETALESSRARPLADTGAPLDTGLSNLFPYATPECVEVPGRRFSGDCSPRPAEDAPTKVRTPHGPLSGGSDGQHR